jgi:hypothetical protein
MSELRPQVLTQRIALPPATMLVGDGSHSDFNDAVQLLRAESRLVDGVNQSPELIVICQTRPGTVHKHFVESLRRAAPLAGVVALVGSWCEGETRTGRPLPGVDRLYWHEFPSWWRRQLAFRAAGRCPDWARAASTRHSEPGRPRPRPAVITIRTDVRETAECLSEVLNRAGFATAWQRGRRGLGIRGASAGVWVGGQLSEYEVADLRASCQMFAGAQGGVLAILDFPRRDSVDRAIKAGAAAVLGMPLRNADLIGTLDALLEREPIRRAA